MKPYSDENMNYREDMHRYVLTEDFVKERLNVDLSAVLKESAFSIDSAIEPAIFLDRVSEQIYDACLTATPFPLRREREMALKPEWRVPIMRAMEEQVQYQLNGNGDSSLESGLNIDRGTVIDRRAMRAFEIAPRALDTLTRYRIFNTSFDFTDREIIPDYEGEGY